MFCGKVVGPAVTFFIFPLFGSFLSEPLSGFYAATKGCRQSRTRRFFCQLLLSAPAVKEEFARNALQNVRDRRDGLYLQR